MKDKIRMIIKFIAISWTTVNIFLIVYVALGNMSIENYLSNSYTTILVMGPLAGSGVLAVIVSEIADKKREGKNEDEVERNI